MIELYLPDTVSSFLNNTVLCARPDAQVIQCYEVSTLCTQLGFNNNLEAQSDFQSFQLKTIGFNFGD